MKIKNFTIGFILLVFSANFSSYAKTKKDWTITRIKKITKLPYYVISHNKKKVTGHWSRNLVSLKKNASVSGEIQRICKKYEVNCQNEIMIKKSKVKNKEVWQIIYLKERKPSNIPAYYQNVINLSSKEKLKEKEINTLIKDIRGYKK